MRGRPSRRGKPPERRCSRAPRRALALQPGRNSRRGARSRDLRSHYPDARAPEAAAKPIGAERTARPQAPARTALAGVLIPAFEGRGRDGVERDSFGRGVDDKSVAAVVASDALVRRELEARSIYLQTAYRDPKAATTRLNELVARDGSRPSRAS